ncbi:DNA-directed DNA polymerase [Tanacetum coccineum]
MTDIPGICLSFCKHKIQLLDDKKPVVQKQRRLNPNMQEVVKEEIMTLLDTGIIYPIADSPWVSPIHCVPKKGGITVVTNENDELVPTRTVTGWRRMPSGLCNAPATFQRCMLAIFHDMIEESVKVFMDDFSIFGNSFDTCLNNLDKLLQHCKDAHLVLNWEKYHFMVKEGIMLGHKVSSAGLEVDKAKIDVILKLPPLLISKLLEKDDSFEFDDECQKAFESLKEKLTCAPVIVSPNWNLQFKLMCDASDFAVGAVLGQKYADHLSQIKNDETSDDSEVDDNFPRETLMENNTKDKPWFADFANYLVGNIIPKGMTYQQKNKFFSDLKHCFWEEPYLFKVCFDGMIRRCISGPETQTILDQCHHVPTGGYYGPNITAKKVPNSGFYWPTIIKEAHTLVCLCEACQKTENISKRDEMPLNNIQNCHLPFEIEHRAYWAMKNCNPYLIAAGEKRMFQLHELDELRYQAYENSRLYKERTKGWHDRKLRMRKEFKQGNKVLLFHSKYKFKQPKLRSRWLGPYVVKHQYPSRYVELYGKDGKTFIVNGHQLKLYHEEDNNSREVVTHFFPKE